MVEEINRRDRKRAQQRRRVYDVALRLFRRRGYEATTVDEIAREADIARATFFNYFPTKEHVLAEYQRRMAREIMAALEARTFRTAGAAVLAAVAECASYALDDPRMARIIIRTIFASDLMLETDGSNERELADWLAERLREGAASGEFRRDVDVTLVVTLVIGVMSATMTEWVSGPRAFDLEGQLGARIRFILAGAAPASTRRTR